MVRGGIRVMTIKEAIHKIKSINKAWLHAEPPMKHDYMSMMCKRILEDKCKPETVDKFLKRFGYKLEVEFKVSRHDKNT